MRRNGVTILELMVVLVVGAVILSVSSPRLARLRDATAVHSATGDLGAALGAARQLALTRRAMVAVLFDTVNGEIRVQSAGALLLQRPLAAAYGIRLHANRDSVVYDPRGLGYGVSNVSVTLRRGAIVDTLTMSRLGRATW